MGNFFRGLCLSLHSQRGKVRGLPQPGKPPQTEVPKERQNPRELCRLCALGFEGEGRGHEPGTQRPLEAGKGKETVFTTASRGLQLYQHLDFAPLRTMSGS